MVENLSIDPSSILGVSFTNKAAKEMRERVHALLRGSAKGITLTTFHSLGVKILQKEINKLGYQRNFSIYATGDQMAIVREALKHLKGDKKFDRAQILSKIGLLKNSGITEEEFANSKYFDFEDPYDLATEHVYRYYQEKLKFYNAIDFDDILFLTVKLFKTYPDLATKYSQRFKYIMIDEYQDTNNLQFDLVLALTSTHNNLCVVGDDDQSIYAFRGADITNILNFEKHFKRTKIVKLEENYRSTTPILKLANSVIKENKSRKDKTLWTQIKSDVSPFLWAMGDSDHEAQIIIDEIAKYQSKGGELIDVAILYRSNNQAPPIEDQLRMNQIPYTVLGGQKFYDKKEVKDLMAYLFVILNPRDETSLRRILNIPHRGIGTITLKKYLDKSKNNRLSLFDCLEKFPALDPKREKHIKTFVKLIRKFQQKFKQASISQSLSNLIEDIDYNRFIEKQYDSHKQIDLRKNDVITFVESASRFERLEKQNANLRSFIEKVLLQDSQDTQEEEEEIEKVNQITMMTLHSSKGLEFDIVYLVGVEEQILPHKRTIEQGEDISEERRLFYVGITRARKKLIMSYCKKRNLYGKDVNCHKSRFLENLPKDKLYVEQDRTTFGHLTEDEAKKYKKDFFNSLINTLD